MGRTCSPKRSVDRLGTPSIEMLAPNESGLRELASGEIHRANRRESGCAAKARAEMEPPIRGRERLPSELAIAEILRAARAAGMTYGEYVSRYEQAKTRREKTK